MNFERAYVTVSGTEKAIKLATKLVQASAYYEMTPLPDNEYEFAVKADRKELLKTKSAKAHEIADEVVLNHDADLAYPKLLHKSAHTRFERFFLRYAGEAAAREGASLSDVYEAAELLQEKYGPSYWIPNVRSQPSFT